MTKKLLPIVVATILLFVYPTWAATYYVQNGGNDSAAGTEGAPWANCPGMTGWTGSTTLSSGDTVYFDAGDDWTGTYNQVLYTTTAGVTYDGYSWDPGTSGTKARFYPTSSWPNGWTYAIVELRHSNTTFKGFEIDGVSNAYNTYGLTVGYSSTVDVDNVLVEDCDVHHIGKDTWLYGVQVSGRDDIGITVSNVTLRGLKVYNCYHEGIAVYDTWNQVNNNTDTVLIDDCESYNNGFNGIEIANDSDNVTIQNCSLHDNGTQGILVRTSPSGEGNCVNGSPQGVVIKNNLIYDNNDGLVVWNQRSGTPCTDQKFEVLAYNNFFWDNATQEVLVMLETYSPGGDYIKLYNNTFYNTVATGVRSTNNVGLIGIGPTNFEPNDGPTTFEFRNNIVVSTNVSSIYEIYYDPTTITDEFSYNIIRNTVSDSNDSVNIGGTDYTNSTYQTLDADGFSTDPSFVNVSGDDYTVNSDSEAINNGVNLSAYFTQDYYSTTRPQGPDYDIGAYELDEGGTITGVSISQLLFLPTY